MVVVVEELVLGGENVVLVHLTDNILIEALARLRSRCESLFHPFASFAVELTATVGALTRTILFELFMLALLEASFPHAALSFELADNQRAADLVNRLFSLLGSGDGCFLIKLGDQGDGRCFGGGLVPGGPVLLLPLPYDPDRLVDVLLLLLCHHLALQLLTLVYPLRRGGLRSIIEHGV